MTDGVDLTEHFKSSLAKDAADYLFGDAIASGAHRCVFEHSLDSALVVKVENNARSFHNVAEHALWEYVKDEPSLRKWFAPVEWISPNGIILVMRRTEPVKLKDLPKKVPGLFTDLHEFNWGRLKGRVVCHDYGTVNGFDVSKFARLRAVKWE